MSHSLQIHSMRKRMRSKGPTGKGVRPRFLRGECTGGNDLTARELKDEAELRMAERWIHSRHQHLTIISISISISRYRYSLKGNSSLPLIIIAIDIDTLTVCY